MGTGEPMESYFLVVVLIYYNIHLYNDSWVKMEKKKKKMTKKKMLLSKILNRRMRIKPFRKRYIYNYVTYFTLDVSLTLCNIVIQ